MSPPGGGTQRLAIGVDVSSVERVARLLGRRPEFLRKYFSPQEAAYCNGRPERLAARWAAKEAVRKVFGELGWHIPLYTEIAVQRRPGGAPQALVRGAPVEGLALSLSHDAGLGMAVAAIDRLGRSGPWLWRSPPTDLRLPERPPEGHKGTFGTVVLVAGSPDFPGAAVLCSLGALRGGAGKVKALVADDGQGLPAEVIRVPVGGERPRLGRSAIVQAAPELQAASAIVCGPGLGQGEETEALLSELFSLTERAEAKLVLDADALNVCSQHRHLLERLPRDCLLTPHPLEASRLAAVPVERVMADREAFARELAGRLGVVLVLKGAGTVVANRTGQSWTDGHATSALASGGTGDVLAGLIGALLAQGLDPYEAARAAVFLHGEAGTRLGRLRGRAGILASEVADALVEAQEALRREHEASRARTPG